MASEMEARVALAICKARCIMGDEPCCDPINNCSPEDGSKLACLYLARAAIRAMREPTPHMCCEGMMVCDIDYGCSFERAYKCMIDAATSQESAAPTEEMKHGTR